MFAVTLEIVFGGLEQIAFGRGRTFGKKLTGLLTFMHRRTCRITRLRCRGSLGPAPTQGPRGVTSRLPACTSVRPRGTRGPAPTGGPRGARSRQRKCTSIRFRGTRARALTGGPRGARLRQPLSTSFRPRGIRGPAPTSGPRGARLLPKNGRAILESLLAVAMYRS